MFNITRLWFWLYVLHFSMEHDNFNQKILTFHISGFRSKFLSNLFVLAYFMLLLDSQPIVINLQIHD